MTLSNKPNAITHLKAKCSVGTLVVVAYSSWVGSMSWVINSMQIWYTCSHFLCAQNAVEKEARVVNFISSSISLLAPLQVISRGCTSDRKRNLGYGGFDGPNLQVGQKEVFGKVGISCKDQVGLRCVSNSVSKLQEATGSVHAFPWRLVLIRSRC